MTNSNALVCGTTMRNVLSFAGVGATPCAMKSAQRIIDEFLAGPRAGAMLLQGDDAACLAQGMGNHRLVPMLRRCLPELKRQKRDYLDYNAKADAVFGATAGVLCAFFLLTEAGVGKLEYVTVVASLETACLRLADDLLRWPSAFPQRHDPVAIERRAVQRATAAMRSTCVGTSLGGLSTNAQLRLILGRMRDAVWIPGAPYDKRA